MCGGWGGGTCTLVAFFFSYLKVWVRCLEFARMLSLTICMYDIERKGEHGVRKARLLLRHGVCMHGSYCISQGYTPFREDWDIGTSVS